jgi:hypothetical protein
MVSAVNRAWSRTGDSRSTAQAYADTAAELEQLGGQRIVPVSEGAIMQMAEEIEKRRKPAPWDPAIAEASRELWSVISRYDGLYRDLTKQRPKLERLRGNPEHAILGDVPAITPVPSTQEMIDQLFGSCGTEQDRLSGAICEPKFATVPQYREATHRVLAQVHALETVDARINAVLHHESLGTEERNQRLIFRLATRLGALEDRINYLEQQAKTKTTKRPRAA